MKNINRQFKGFRLDSSLVMRLSVVAVKQRKRANRVLEEIITQWLEQYEQSEQSEAAQTQAMVSNA